MNRECALSTFSQKTFVNINVENINRDRRYLKMGNCLNLCDVIEEMENNTFAVFLFGNSKKNFPIDHFPCLVTKGLIDDPSQKSLISTKNNSKL